MKLINFDSVTTSLVAGTYIGEYKIHKAFINIGKCGGVINIVLDDATNLFGESLDYIRWDELMIHIDECEQSKQNEETIENKKIIEQQWVRIRNLEANEDENKRGKIIAERILKEKQERHNAQLRAIFYMLEELTSEGTHREKAVLIRYIRASIAKYIKWDSLDQYGAPDDLPF